MKHGWTTFLAVLGTTVGVILLAVLKINPPSQTVLRTIAGIAWPLLLLIAYFLYYLVRATNYLTHKILLGWRDGFCRQGSADHDCGPLA